MSYDFVNVMSCDCVTMWWVVTGCNWSACSQLFANKRNSELVTNTSALKNFAEVFFLNCLCNAIFVICYIPGDFKSNAIFSFIIWH